MPKYPLSGKERNENRTTLWEGEELKQDHALGRKRMTTGALSGKERNDKRTTHLGGKE
jgi:hypothetical protein